MNDASAVGRTLYLRPLEQDDAPALLRWFEDPEVTRTLWRAPAGGAEASYLEEIARSERDVTLGVCSRAEDRLLGLVALQGFEEKDRSARFGVAIGEKEDWGRGYGTEATALMVGLGFESLGLQRIWLEVDAGNERGLRAYERVGFRHEGRGGDPLVMAILCRDWRPAPPP